MHKSSVALIALLLASRWDAVFSRVVTGGIAALNHRLQAAKPSASQNRLR
jgi:hypothetical protein